MPKRISINPKDMGLVADKIRRAILMMALRGFWVIIFFVFVDFLLGGVLFYKYVISVREKEPQLTEEPVKFKEREYQSVLKEWEARQVFFDQNHANDYQDPFNAKASEEKDK